MNVLTDYQLPDSLGPKERVQVYFPVDLYDKILELPGRGREPNWKTIARMALEGLNAAFPQEDVA